MSAKKVVEVGNPNHDPASGQFSSGGGGGGGRKARTSKRTGKPNRTEVAFAKTRAAKTLDQAASDARAPGAFVRSAVRSGAIIKRSGNLHAEPGMKTFILKDRGQGVEVKAHSHADAKKLAAANFGTTLADSDKNRKAISSARRADRTAARAKTAPGWHPMLKGAAGTDKPPPKETLHPMLKGANTAGTPLAKGKGRKARTARRAAESAAADVSAGCPPRDR